MATTDSAYPFLIFHEGKNCWDMKWIQQVLEL
jgi:hypothetical protein